jgi:hypothetical protein
LITNSTADALYSSVNALRVDPIVGSPHCQERAEYVPPSTEPGTVQTALPRVLGAIVRARNMSELARRDGL